MRMLVEDGGGQLAHKLRSITSIETEIKGSPAERQCQTAQHQRSNDLVWAHVWEPNQGGEDKPGHQGHVGVGEFKLQNQRQHTLEELSYVPVMCYL